jgi:hypothetical protein
MNYRQLFGYLLLGCAGALLGVIISLIIMGGACILLYYTGMIEKYDAMVKLKLFVIIFGVLGFILGIVRAAKMVQ